MKIQNVQFLQYNLVFQHSLGRKRSECDTTIFVLNNYITKEFSFCKPGKRLLFIIHTGF